jgi:hypothetical protein
MPLWLVPIIVLGSLLVLLGLFALLGRIQNGRFLRPIFAFLAKVPLLGKGIEKLSRAALERSNPDLASAIRKLERSGATRDPTRAQKAMSQLTAAERRAYLDAAGSSDAMQQPVNRQQRRAAQRVRKRG